MYFQKHLVLKHAMAVALHFETLGRGRPIMILHGLFGSARNWQGIAGQLCTNYRLIMVDLRNHGHSPHHHKTGYVDMAEDLRALMKMLNMEKVSLLGHSMGGKVAMLFALHYPGLIDKLLVMDIAPVSYVRGFAALIDAMLALPLEDIQNRSDAARILEHDVADAGVRTFLLQNLVRKKDGYEWRLNLHALKAGLRELGDFPRQDRQYHGPALFLGGADSDYLLPGHHPAIHALFPHARIEMIPGAGHWLHADQPQGVIDHIKRFIGE